MDELSVMDAAGFFFLGFVWGVAALQLRLDWKDREQRRINLYIDGELAADAVMPNGKKLPHVKGGRG